MATKATKKGQARRMMPDPLPSWVWLMLGAAVTAALYVIVPYFMKRQKDDFFLPATVATTTSKPEGQPTLRAPVVPNANSHSGPALAPTRNKPQYDFYTLLPAKEIRLSEAEIAAHAHAEAEEAARARAALAGKPVPTRHLAERPATPSPGLTPLTATNRLTPNPAKNLLSEASTSTPQEQALGRTPSTPQFSNLTSGHYLLQAGAFGGQADAESTKAHLAILGVSARIESAQTKDQRVIYRVRLGPYATAGELAAVKHKLETIGVNAIAIKAQ